MDSRRRSAVPILGHMGLCAIVDPMSSTNDQPLNEESEPRTMPTLSRRALLRTLAGGAALATVTACGGGGESPVTPADYPAPASPAPFTPGPYPGPATPGGGAVPGATAVVEGAYDQYLPLVSNQSAPTPEPTLTPTPPKATSVPLPQATSTPVATPFPPGPPSKLGIFIGRNEPELFRLLRAGGVAVVKTLELDPNFAGEIKQVSPQTKVIGRIDLPQIQLSSLDPIPAAQDFVNKLMEVADDAQRRQLFDAWEAYNEPVAGNADEMKRLADFEAERTRLLGARGIRSVIGNFGTGQPPLELWEHFLPAVQAAKENDGWLGLHEYSAPTIYYLSTRQDQGRYPGVTPGDTGWLTLRYRHVYNDILRPAGLAIPLVMTELGVDGLVANRPGPPDGRGWQNFQDFWAQNGYGLWGPGAYIEQLVWYDQAMQQDSYVIGGCIYALAPPGGWHTYDIIGSATGVLEQYLSVHRLNG